MQMTRYISLTVLNLLAAASLNVAAAQDGASIYAPAGTNSSGYSMGSESPLYNGLPAEYNNAPYVPPSGFIPAIRLNAGLTQSLLDFQNRQADKELLLIDPAFHGGTEGVGLTLGGQLRASAMVGRTNTTDKFSYLGRFPTDFTGNTVTDARLLQANQAFVARFSPWAHGYMETLFSDVFTFPAPKQGSFQMRQAYVVFGNLEQSPWYAFMGKKTVSFGDMGTLSPFSQSMIWHYFSPLAEGIGGGYAAGGFNLSATALNGSRGIRVADSEEKGHLNNFAVNARYDVPFGDDAGLAIGAGYLHGSIYDGPTAEHLDPTVVGPMNGLWDVNASIFWGSWQFEGEVVQTMNEWPTTSHKVTAYRLESALDLLWLGKDMRLSGSWSEGIQGPRSAEYEFNQQFVLGLQCDLSPNVIMSFEYIRSMGFAPLINVTTVSDKSVVQNSFVFGLTLTL